MSSSSASAMPEFLTDHPMEVLRTGTGVTSSSKKPLGVVSSKSSSQPSDPLATGIDFFVEAYFDSLYFHRVYFNRVYFRRLLFIFVSVILLLFGSGYGSTSLLPDQTCEECCPKRERSMPWPK
jgi:hypothetical protein